MKRKDRKSSTEGRSRGEETRNRILSRAVRLAAVEGLAGLTIGRLARELNMTKSGLFAHFRSKERLKLATVGHAREIFRAEVLLPAAGRPEGIERLWSLCDLWLKHIERRVFPGSYFFIGAFFAYADRPEPISRPIIAVIKEWFSALRDATNGAQKRGEIDREADPKRIAFELNGPLIAAYWAHLLRDGDAFREARMAILGKLQEHSREQIPGDAFESVGAWIAFLKERRK